MRVVVTMSLTICVIHKGLLIALMCLSGQILASPVGAPGCYYNGQFRIGNWTDGCDFSCSCEDPEIGHYRCVVRCPLYRNIPNGCVLVKPDGETCCFEMDCSMANHSRTHYTDNKNETNNDEIIKRNETARFVSIQTTENVDAEYGCFYKGKYHEGEWNDSCEHTCVCENPETGLYTCHERCSINPETPRGCILQVAAPNECCPSFVCDNTDSDNADLALEIKTDNLRINGALRKNTSQAPVSQHLMEYEGVRETKIMDLIDENYTLPPYKLNAVTDERSLAKSKNAIMRLIPSHLSSLPVFNDNKRAYKPIESVYTNKDGDFLINKQKSPKDLIETNIHATNVEHNKETIVTKRCFYNGTEYAIGDRWSDGCNATCVCAHPSRGHIICRNRCDEFNRLPPGCVQRMSPVDDCCKIPDCRFGNILKRNAHGNTLAMISRYGHIGNMLTRHSFNERMRERHGNQLSHNGHKTVANTNNGLQSYYNSRGIIIPHLSYDLKSEISVVPSHTRSDIKSITKDRVNMTSISNHDQNNEATVQPHADLSSMTLSSTAIYGNVLTSISPSKELSDKSTETCAHGVNVYDVGDTWHLNCSVYCRCFPHQQVVCRSSCFNYGIIPRGCQLASPHGESCCKLLVCLNLHNIRSFGTPQWSTKPMLDPLDVLKNKLKPNILDVWKTKDLYNGEQSKTSKSLSKEASMQPTYSISSNLAARQGFGIRMPPRTLFIPYRDESSMSTLSTMIRPVMISSSSEERLKSNNDLKVQLPKQNTESESILHNDISLPNNNAFVGSYPTDSLNSPVTDLHLSPFAKVDAYILDKRKEMSITTMGKILGCTIRGKLVRQGENWIENCERKCICEDEINHRISCVPFRFKYL